MFLIKKDKDTTPWTYVIEHLMIKKLQDFLGARVAKDKKDCF